MRILGLEISKAQPPAPVQAPPAPPAPEPEPASAKGLGSFAALAESLTRAGALPPNLAGREREILQATGSGGGTGRRLPITELRWLADEADLVRLAIEDVKSTVRGLEWTIETDGSRDVEARAYQLLERPDGKRDWDAWASMALEEALVTDAACFFPWWRSGRVERLELVDFKTIRMLPLVDGRLPEPPAPAFEQVSTGRRYTTDELWYMPRNIRVTTLQGCSPVEQVAYRSLINLHSVLSDVARWMGGGMPPAYIGSPDAAWKLEQIQAYQRWLDERSRDRAAMTRPQVVAGDPNVKLTPWPKIDKAHEELLVRVICKAFGTDPTAMVSEVNYSTANALERQAMLRGIRPWLYFLQWVANRLLEGAGLGDHRLTWQVDVEARAQASDDRLLEDYKVGLVSWQEMRQLRGRSIEAEDLAGHTFIMLFGQPSNFAPVGTGILPPPQALPVPASAQRPEHEEATEPEAEKATRSSAASARDELARCHRMVARSIRKGSRPRAFASEVLPAWRLRLANTAARRGRLDLIKAGSAPESRHDFTNQTSSERVQRKLEDGAELFAKLVRVQAEPLVEAALKDLKAAQKAGAFEAATLVPPPEALWHETIDWLTLMELAGIQDASEWVGLGQVEGAALEHAQERAGELIGMRLDADLGEWVPSPDPDLALSRTTRSRIERLLAKGIDEGWSVGTLRGKIDEVLDDPARAATIARTEAGYAYNRGTATTWQELGITHVRIYDDEGPNSCEACEQANGQIWTVEHYLENLLEHPSCVRSAWPVDAP